MGRCAETMASKHKKEIDGAPKKESIRAFVRVDTDEQKAVEELAESMARTPAEVRTMAFKAGLEILKSQTLGADENGAGNVMGHPRMSEAQKADLEARIDDLEVRISSVSDAVLGSLAMLSLILDRYTETTRSDGQEEG